MSEATMDMAVLTFVVALLVVLAAIAVVDPAVIKLAFTQAY